MPNVTKAYQEYHPKGFEILGISLDKDKERLTKFMAEKGMTWPQYFDGKGWKNELAQMYGVSSIPATFLLDPKGNIIAKGLRGAKLEEAVKEAVAQLGKTGDQE